MTVCGWFAPFRGTGYLARAGGPGEMPLRPAERDLASTRPRQTRAGRVSVRVARAEVISASAAEDGQVGFGDAAGVVDEVDRNDLRAGDRERLE